MYFLVIRRWSTGPTAKQDYQALFPKNCIWIKFNLRIFKCHKETRIQDILLWFPRIVPKLFQGNFTFNSIFLDQDRHNGRISRRKKKRIRGKGSSTEQNNEAKLTWETILSTWWETRLCSTDTEGELRTRSKKIRLLSERFRCAKFLPLSVVSSGSFQLHKYPFDDRFYPC